jgi:hypothetical protein
LALGDGIRRDIAKVSQEERERLRDAFVQLHTRAYPGSREDIPAGGVSFWFKQDEIHQSTHVHAFFPWRGISFLPWHRELCNRLEILLREVDPAVSLHYWDWTTDPDPEIGRETTDRLVNIFSQHFMGAATGEAREPWLGARFYDPNATLDRDTTGNPFDPPIDILRSVGRGAPVFKWSDSDIVAAETYPEMRRRLEDVHNASHGYIGGTISDPHASFRDPFVFLLHSNVDRLFALWQLQSGKEWRLDPEQVFGVESNTDIVLGSPIYDPGILSPLEPWAGNFYNHPEVRRIRPWTHPENEHLLPENRKNSKHSSVVVPPAYDTNPPK